MASRGVNKVIIVGNLGNDPETRYMPSGGAVTNASIATSEHWKDKQTGEDKEVTEWHRVVFMDRGNFKLGEIAGQWLKKGSKVYVEGQLRTRKWQDQAGNDKYSTEVIANEMQMLDPKPQDGGQQGGHRQQAPAPQQNPAPQPQASSNAGMNQQQSPPPYAEFEDDIPF